MAAPARSRLLELTRLRCDVFSTLYNPLGLRTGAKYLRARLRGPSMVQYYPKQLSFKDLSRAMPELKLVNFEEEQRLFDVAERKKRGKGAPKKAKSPGTWDFACSSCTTHSPPTYRGEPTSCKEKEKVTGYSAALFLSYRTSFLDTALFIILCNCYGHTLRTRKGIELHDGQIVQDETFVTKEKRKIQMPHPG